MSITIRTTSRFAQSTDTNNNTENVNGLNQADRQVTAADRATRRAKRAQRLALQTESTNLPTESTNATNRVVDNSSTVTLNENKTEPSFLAKMSNITLDEKRVGEKPDSARSGVPGKTDRKPGLVKDGIAVNVISNAISNMISGEKKNAVKAIPGNGVRGKINTWSQSSAAPKYGTAAGTSKFQFGIDYNTKKTSTSTSEASVPGSASANKYTPTMNRTGQRPYSTGFVPTSKIGGSSSNTGRFQGIQNDELAMPSFGGSATDRMTRFRESMEKEQAQKAKEAERKKQAEEKKKLTLEKRKQDEEKRKQEELNKKKEDEKTALEAKAEKEEKDAVPDSEKIKHVAPCQKRKEKKPARRTMSISNIVLDWVQEMTKEYPVEIKNFSGSWNNGMAFCALIHKFNPDEFDFNELKPENKRYNFDLAFNTGAKTKNIPILLDTEDMVRMTKPEPRSVQCYIQWIWSVYGPTSGYGPTPQEVQNATIS